MKLISDYLFIIAYRNCLLLLETNYVILKLPYYIKNLIKCIFMHILPLVFVWVFVRKCNNLNNRFPFKYACGLGKLFFLLTCVWIRECYDRFF